MTGVMRKRVTERKLSHTGIWRRNRHRILKLTSVSIGEEAMQWFQKHCGEQLRARQTQIQFLTSGLAFKLPRPHKLPRSKASGRQKTVPCLPSWD